MARVLLQNALEAAIQAAPRARWVECTSTMIGDTPKLTFRNSGPGLGRRELVQLTNIAERIGNTMGVKEN